MASSLYSATDTVPLRSKNGGEDGAVFPRIGCCCTIGLLLLPPDVQELVCAFQEDDGVYSSVICGGMGVGASGGGPATAPAE